VQHSTLKRFRQLILIVPTLLLCGLALLSESCNRHWDPSDIPGAYVATDSEEDQLNIRSDGTYKHDYLSGRSKMSESGTYVVERNADGDLGVTFDSFKLADRTGFTRGRGIWFVRPERRWNGVVRLPMEPKIGLYFEKVK